MTWRLVVVSAIISIRFAAGLEGRFLRRLCNQNPSPASAGVSVVSISAMSGYGAFGLN